MNIKALHVVAIIVRIMVGFTLIVSGIAMLTYAVTVLRVHPAGSIDWVHGVSISLIPLGIGGFVAVGGLSKRKKP
jgi:hypothetical protein